MDTTAPSDIVVSNKTAPKAPTAIIQSQRYGSPDDSHPAMSEVVVPNLLCDLSENQATTANRAELLPTVLFPPELLRMITKHFGERKPQADLADLWMNVFKEEVEENFPKGALAEDMVAPWEQYFTLLSLAAS